MPNRIPRVRDRLSEMEADALCLTSLPNIRWACGFTGSNGLLIVGPTSSHFVTDGRYTEQAKDEVQGPQVTIAEEGLTECIAQTDLLAPYDRVAFQADDLTVARRDALADAHQAVKWVPETSLLTAQVASKAPSEVDKIRAAQQITESVFDEIVGVMEPGMTEREVGAEIVYRHLKKGADSMAFDPIVASGPNGARPHARPTDRILREGELIVLDMGCFHNGYASDMTRTVALGEPSTAARKGYEAVLEAQTAALHAAKAGMKSNELDEVARAVLRSADLEEYFSHGLGHGLGLEVHEWPRVSHTSEEELPDGACVTIEPGVYDPEKGYGVRIEDIVVLHNDGHDNLTETPKELRIL